MKLNKTQVLVILGSVVLFVLLIFANTKIPKKEEDVGMSDHAGPKQNNIDNLLEQTLTGLTPAEKQSYSNDEAALNVSSNKQEEFKNIVNRWDSLRQPLIAAHYKELESLSYPTEKNWEEVGNRYYALTGFVAENDRMGVYDKVIECFEKVLVKNPDNTEVKISLASSYVERGVEPMKGIGMLREVEKTDSNNVKLQLSFAFFSVKSGQLDKAIKRFEKVLTIQPDYIEAYLHLADIYEQKGDKAKTIESLEKYVGLTDDLTLKNEVKGYINKLKN